MRRVVSPIMIAFGMVGLSLSLVGVNLSFGAVPASAAAGKKVCTIADPRLVDMSGLVVTETGYIVINSSSDVESRKRVFFLNSKCKVQNAVSYGGKGPRDPEDLALSADGKTLWIADTGDNATNAERRSSVVLWSLPVDGSARPVLHRLTYPGGKAHDAEALLMGDDDTPYIITKTAGPAEIYRPTAPLQKNNDQGVPMEKAGDITLPKTTTDNPHKATGRLTITGAARSPDGKRIVLRTYADAFEWDLQDGDIVKTLTSGTPRVTPLSDLFGEAIAYTPDGTTFVTVSDVGSLGPEAEREMLSYTPAAPAPPAADGDAQKKKVGQSWSDRLTLDDITYLIAAVGVLGAMLVGLGVFGIFRSRRKKPGGDDAGSSGSDGGDGSLGDSGWRPSSGGHRVDRTAGDRGSAAPGGRSSGGGGSAGGGVYGGGGSAGGGVYGGGRSSSGYDDERGGHYGRPQANRSGYPGNDSGYR